MIPRICANCAHGSNINNAQNQIVITICGYMPIGITKKPDETCGCYAMSDTPSINVPDEPAVEIIEGVDEVEQDDE